MKLDLSACLDLANRAIIPAFRRHLRELAASCFWLITTTISSILVIELGRELFTIIQRTDASRPVIGLLLVMPGLTQAQTFAWCGALSLVLLSVTWLGVYFRNLSFERLALASIQSLRVALYSHILRLPYERLAALRPGVLTKRIIEDTAQLRPFIVDVLLRRIADLLLVMTVLVYLAHLNLLLAVCTTVALIIYFIVGFWSATRAKTYMNDRERSKDELAAHATEGSSRLLDIRGGARESYEEERFAVVAAENEGRSASCAKWIVLDFALTGYIRALGPVALLLFGGWMAMNGEMTQELLFTVVATTSFLYAPVDAISAITVTLRQVEIAAENLLGILDEPTEDTNWSGAARDAQLNSDKPVISFSNVRFSYPCGKQSLMIDRIEIPQGTAVAIVGASGIGKTTLLRLMFGMLPKFSGDIHFAGQNIKDLSLPFLRTFMTFMPQENGLFAGSIRDNIAYGAEDPKQATNADICTSADVAGLADDLRHMSLGIDTNVNVIGQNLSAGQRRRVILARTLMRTPRLILFDEPLSGLSPQERNSIIQSILKLKATTTIILTSHDYEMLESFDIIINFRRLEAAPNHVVVDVGSHKHLKNTCHEYRIAVGRTKNALKA